jgi:hypothetical protein
VRRLAFLHGGTFRLVALAFKQVRTCRPPVRARKPRIRFAQL